METNKVLWKLLACSCLLMALISNMGSVKNKPCDWTQYHGNEAHTAHCDTSIVPPLDILWKETLERGAISGSPLGSGDHLVLISTLGTLTSDCYLLCYRMHETGLQLVWSQFLSWVELGVSPAITQDVVICPSRDKLHCFDLETGHQLWEIAMESTPTTPTIIQDADLAATVGFAKTPGGNGYLFLVDISSGEVVWTKTSLEGSSCLFLDIVTAGDDKLFVYYSTPDEEGIAAFNLQGELLWKRLGRLYSKCVNDNSIITLYTGNTLFVVGSPNGTLFALNDKSGDVLWSREGELFLDVLSSDGTYLYVYSRTDKAVLCLDIYTGEEIWESPPLFPEDGELCIFVDKSLVSTRNCIFICRHIKDNDGTARILGLDSSTGEVVWSSEDIESLVGPLIICHDILIAQTTKTLLGFGELRDTGPPHPAPTLSTQPEPSSPIPTFAVLIFVGIFGGILIAYYLLRKE